MRYIGNKTRLLPFLRSTLRRLGVTAGIAHDAFAGTASVGRALKEDGWRVVSSDLMTYSHVLQQAYVVARRVPSFRLLIAGDAELRRALRSPALRQSSNGAGSAGMLSRVASYCSTLLPPRRDFMTEEYTPVGAAGRMYFTPDNGSRLDAVRAQLHGWKTAGLLDDAAYHLLLAALLEGADRVANTAGVYAAYIKSWQPNALRPLELQPRVPVPGGGCKAFQGDAVEVASRIGKVDLLYVDPPYNSRQYVGYYHVPEIIARGWHPEPPPIAGRTGLLAEHDLRSDWCSAGRVRGAMADLLTATGARHILVSYNSEGLLPEGELRDLLRGGAVDGKARCFRLPYRRYRADSDRAGRSYSGDQVDELLFHARLR
jgi:adenine-specific DNA-methyltransferase